MRISPTEALGLLRPAFEPTAAADELTKAIHRGKRVYCNGEIIKPLIAVDIVVVHILENDGTSTAAIASASNTWAGNMYKWELEVDWVVALLPRDRGTKLKTAVTIALNRLGLKAVLDLKNSGQLRPHLKHFLKENGVPVPKDPRSLNRIVRGFESGTEKT